MDALDQDISFDVMKNSIEELEEFVANSEDVRVPMDDCTNGDIISKRVDYFKYYLGNDNMVVGCMGVLMTCWFVRMKLSLVWI